MLPKCAVIQKFTFTENPVRKTQLDFYDWSPAELVRKAKVFRRTGIADERQRELAENFEKRKNILASGKQH